MHGCALRGTEIMEKEGRVRTIFIGIILLYVHDSYWHRIPGISDRMEEIVNEHRLIKESLDSEVEKDLEWNG